jgi:hypothetical protein
MKKITFLTLIICFLCFFEAKAQFNIKNPNNVVSAVPPGNLVTLEANWQNSGQPCYFTWRSNPINSPLIATMSGTTPTSPASYSYITFNDTWGVARIECVARINGREL